MYHIFQLKEGYAGALEVNNGIKNFWNLGHSRNGAVQETFLDSRYVQLQIHHTDDVGVLSPKADFVRGTEAIYLRLGNEYHIDVTPVGSRSSDNLKALDAEDRNCLLENEISQESIFKRYTESNCKYECHVTIAKQNCGCVPWDFMAKATHLGDECDVFGRTCFFKEIKEIALNPEDVCPHCKEACDKTEFVKKVVKSGPAQKYLINILANKTFIGSDIANFGSTIINHNSIDEKHLLDDEPNLYENLIVVHLRFLTSEIESVDLAYSIWDKFANLGGNFGIFVEITGFSFLGILNIVILLLKLACTRVLSKCKRKNAKPHPQPLKVSEAKKP